MYIWYKEAQVCYAYLEDVEAGDSVSTIDSMFGKSRWFTRGWTLQELIAPKELVFYSVQWKEIGRKRDLPKTIWRITRIPEAILLGFPLYDASVAQRMSWVSKRQTTKPEDIAYCLMGIFEVHMPLLYGEREEAAFQRLQQEILKESDDTSIFAWRTSISGVDPHIAANQTYGLRARSPKLFDQSHNIVRAEMPMIKDYVKGTRSPITIDNKGLHSCLPLNVTLTGPTQAILGCRRAGKMGHYVAIWMRDISTNGGRYVRICGFELSNISLVSIRQSFEFRDLNTERRIFTHVPRVLLQDHLGPENQELRSAIQSVYTAAPRASVAPSRIPGILSGVPPLFLGDDTRKQVLTEREKREQTASAPVISTRKRLFEEDT